MRSNLFNQALGSQCLNRGQLKNPLTRLLGSPASLALATFAIASSQPLP